MKEYISARHRAEKIRESAKSGNYSFIDLANEYGLSVSMVRRILYNEKCKTTDSEPIKIRQLKTDAMAHRVILLRYLCGLTFREIGEACNISPNFAHYLTKRHIKGEMPEVQIQLTKAILDIYNKPVFIGLYTLLYGDTESQLLTNTKSIVVKTIDLFQKVQIL